MSSVKKELPWRYVIIGSLVVGVGLGLGMRLSYTLTDIGGILGGVLWVLGFILAGLGFLLFLIFVFFFSWNMPFKKCFVVLLLCIGLVYPIGMVGVDVAKDTVKDTIKATAILEGHDGIQSVKVTLEGKPSGYSYVVRVEKSTEYTDWYEQKSVTSDDLADENETLWFPLIISGNYGKIDPSSVKVNRVMAEVFHQGTNYPIYSQYLIVRPEDVQVVPTKSVLSNDSGQGSVFHGSPLARTDHATYYLQPPQSPPALAHTAHRPFGQFDAPTVLNQPQGRPS